MATKPSTLYEKCIEAKKQFEAHAEALNHALKDQHYSKFDSIFPPQIEDAFLIKGYYETRASNFFHSGDKQSYYHFLEWAREHGFVVEEKSLEDNLDRPYTVVRLSIS